VKSQDVSSYLPNTMTSFACETIIPDVMVFVLRTARFTDRTISIGRALQFARMGYTGA